MSTRAPNGNWSIAQAYIDAKVDALRDELRALERATEGRFRDSELARNEGLNRALQLLREGMDRIESRTNEKFAERDKATEKAADVSHERMSQIYQFRDQINSERLSYVTRDQLEDNQKGILSEVDILKRAVTLTSGRETGTSRTWSGIVIAFSILSALSAAITAAGIFLKH